MGALISSLPVTQAGTPPSKQPLASRFRETVLQFLDSAGYPSQICHYPRSTELEKTLRDQIDSYGPDISAWSKKMIRTACDMAEYIYSTHSPEVKLAIAQFTWFGMYLEDHAAKVKPQSLEAFQERFSLGTKQLDPVLDHFADYLRSLWTLYPPFSANAMVLSALDFTSSCYLEVATAGMEISPHAKRYPDYLRAKTGVADIYVFFMWPTSQFPDMTAYIQAVPSISHFASIVNDFFSFYKEELDHETANYVHLLARVRGKTDALDVVDEIGQEALQLAENISNTLSGDAKEVWEQWKIGYISFHLVVERYKLADLDLFTPLQSNGVALSSG